MTNPATPDRPAPTPPSDPTAPASSRFAAAAQGKDKPATAEQAPAPRPPEQERRRGNDRRQSETPRDEHGNVQGNTYTGPDRRSGLDRRAYLARQREIVRAEKSAFIQRSMLTFTFFFIVITLAGIFLLAPEYIWMKKRAAQPPAPQPRHVEASEPDVPLGARMNRQIEAAEQAAPNAMAAAQDMLSHAGTVSAAAVQAARQLAAGDASGLRDLVNFVGRVNEGAATPQGRAQLQASVGEIKNLLSGWQGDAAGLGQAVSQARAKDPYLNQMLSNVATPDASAAVMLLLLGEFRNNVNTGRPFADDLAVVQHLAGNNPELQKSLAKLAPYAQTGVLNPAVLQKQLGGLAMEIVAAKARGENANIADRAEARFGQMIRVRDVNVMQGESADAVVNRAQALLARGDVNGAVAELQSLQGAQAQAAAPFIAQAQGTMLADQSSEMLADSVLGQLAAGGGVSAEGLRGLIGNGLGLGNSGPINPMSGK